MTRKPDAALIERPTKSLGLLARGEVVEVDRSSLVAGYIGQTAIKVGEALDAALDGVFFVVEAYSLFSPSERDFGHEAVPPKRPPTGCARTAPS